MSWMKRDPVWRYSQSVQYGAQERLSYSNFFPPFEFQDIKPPADFLIRDEELGFVLFGAMRGHVVGLRYYSGAVNNNEMVALQRELINPYDKNTIKVNNMNGKQVGNLKKELAAALAYIMDNRLAQVEGVVPFGASDAFTLPLYLTFWGKEENRKAVLDHLKKHGFRLGPTPKRSSLEHAWGSGRDGSSSSRPDHVAVQLTIEQVRRRHSSIPKHAESFVARLELALQSFPTVLSVTLGRVLSWQAIMEFDKIFEDIKEDDRTIEMEPAEAIETPLLPHQKQALAWMIARENNKELAPFWEQRDDLYYNTITNYSVKERPENVHGGILADDMGLGKTLTAIALILTNFEDGRPLIGKRGKKNHPGKEYKDETIKLRGSNTDEKVDRHSEPSTCSEEASVSHMLEKSDDTVTALSGACTERRNFSVQHTESSDSEEIEINELPQNMRGSSKVKEDTKFAHALTFFASATKREMLKRGASVMEAAKMCDSGERRRTTLVICPLSLLGSWIDQFQQHIKSEVQLNFYVYYGPDRVRDSSWLSKQDIILTTYNILTYDYGTSDDSPLHYIRWLRVVLDEGHTIRNPNAQQIRAIHELDTERRWILTGTPIQNSLKDLWCLVSFLKLKPFNEREWWHRIIHRPVTIGDEGGLRRLQFLIKNTTLRRTKTSTIKGKPVLELPERKLIIQHVILSEEERKIYQSVKNEGTAALGRYFTEGTVLAHYADVMSLMLRLRQICCHIHLTNGTSSSGPSRSDTPEELRKMLVEKMKLIVSSGSDEECAVCLDSLACPVITHCAHVFCKSCICRVIQCEQPHAKCPLCRNNIHGNNLLECPPEELACDNDKKSSKEWMSSSKINALMHALIELRTKNPEIKSLIVSQFTTFLSLIETPLKESGFVFIRLDGSLTQKKRIESIKSFQSRKAGSPTVMLLSLKTGGPSLNLCAASRVFLMDPAWNPAVEEQCFDRCHQVGQRQEVIITKFIVKDSVEENMLKIQNMKREFTAEAFGTKKLDANEMKQAKINEIRTLIDL